jgi:hypothetical protein
MSHTCRYDDIVIMPNYDARLGMYAPPTGYVATMHEDTTFRIEMIDPSIFRGVAVIDLTTRRERFRDTELQTFLVRMNQIIRDESPRPAPARGWVCSLGPFAWAGVYEKRGGSGPPSYSLVVMSGLDCKTYEALVDELLERAHDKMTVEEVCRTILPRYREFARVNRARLLALMLPILGEEPSGGYAQPGEPYPVSPADASTVPEEIWRWIPGPARIPAWYSMPARTPRGCEPFDPSFRLMPVGERMTLAETIARGEGPTPRAVIPTLDIVVDDLRPYPHSIPGQSIRYAGCCDANSTYATVGGPFDPVAVSAGPGEPDAHFSAPGQARIRKFDASGADEPYHTWEDPELESNRLAGMRAPTAQNARYYPLAVRISCRDSDGLTRDPGPRRRMSGFHGGDSWQGVGSQSVTPN